MRTMEDKQEDKQENEDNEDKQDNERFSYRHDTCQTCLQFSSTKPEIIPLSSTDLCTYVSTYKQSYREMH